MEHRRQLAQQAALVDACLKANREAKGVRYKCSVCYYLQLDIVVIFIK